jgi:hypothetical protein
MMTMPHARQTVSTRAVPSLLGNGPNSSTQGLPGSVKAGSEHRIGWRRLPPPHRASADSLGEVDEGELYDALDWLLECQPAIEATLVLDDVSSSYLEGRCCPVAIEVFDGNTADPMTLASQIEKLKQRFRLDHVVLVGDRGMVTQARITADIKSAGWTGSPRCAHQRSRDWWTAARCNSRCSISATWPASPRLFSRRTPGGVPQSRSRRGAYPQARRPPCRHRA